MCACVCILCTKRRCIWINNNENCTRFSGLFCCKRTVKMFSVRLEDLRTYLCHGNKFSLRSLFCDLGTTLWIGNTLTLEIKHTVWNALLCKLQYTWYMFGLPKRQFCAYFQNTSLQLFSSSLKRHVMTHTAMMGSIYTVHKFPLRKVQMFSSNCRKTQTSLHFLSWIHKWGNWMNNNFCIDLGLSVFCLCNKHLW